MTEIKITMDDSGKIKVFGPLENQLICLGLIEIAKQVIIEQGKVAMLSKMNKSNILKPS
jgi:hypothetical protein